MLNNFFTSSNWFVLFFYLRIIWQNISNVMRAQNDNVLNHPRGSFESNDTCHQQLSSRFQFVKCCQNLMNQFKYLVEIFSRLFFFDKQFLHHRISIKIYHKIMKWKVFNRKFQIIQFHFKKAEMGWKMFLIISDYPCGFDTKPDKASSAGLQSC